MEDFRKRTKIDYIEGNIQFCHFLAKKYYTSYLTLKEAEKHIQEFVDDLKERNLSSNTIHDYLASVCKTFGKYMGDYEHPIRHGVCLKVEPMKYNTKLGEKARDLGLLTGLRRNELAQLKIKDIKFIDCETVHIFSIGKGGKHNRTVLKGIVAVEKLKEYIREAEEKGSDYLLTKPKHEFQMHFITVEQYVHRIPIMPFCRKWKMILQSVQNTFRKSRTSLNVARESSRRILTNLIDLEDITEKQHCLSAESE